MLLLDTHIWWWAISEPEHLSEEYLQILNNESNTTKAVASISIWEFAMMTTKGRIDLTIDPKEWFYHAIHEVGTKIIPLSVDIALDSCNLQGNFHKDPADRIIVATAIKHNALLITKDKKILNYPHVNTFK